jgi:hypothetical protein
MLGGSPLGGFLLGGPVDSSLTRVDPRVYVTLDPATSLIVLDRDDVTNKTALGHSTVQLDAQDTEVSLDG